MNQTFQNSAQVLSIGIFFSLMILGLAATLPHALASGLEAHGVVPAAAHHASQAPPISILFASFLGYNPASHLLGHHVIAQLPHHAAATITGRSFFPAADLRTVPHRPARGVRLRDRSVPAGRARLVVARQPLRGG